jgi:hypothetical protein
MNKVVWMFRTNRYFKGVLCVHNSLKTFDEFLKIIPPTRIQKYDDILEGHHDAADNNGLSNARKINHNLGQTEDEHEIKEELAKIHHFQFLSQEQYFPIDAFDDEQLDIIREANYYKYNTYIIEMPSKYKGIFIAAPYWEIISELSHLITDRLIGRMLYCYVSPEKLIKEIRKLDLDGRLKLAGGSFQVGGDTKIRNIQLRGTNILETTDFSFIFDNPKKYAPTEVRLIYTKGLSIKSSLRCDTKGRFRFHHPKKSDNLIYVYKIIKYLIENDLLLKTEIKPFELKPEELSTESR